MCARSKWSPELTNDPTIASDGVTRFYPRDWCVYARAERRHRWTEHTGATSRRKQIKTKRRSGRADKIAQSEQATIKTQ